MKIIFMALSWTKLSFFKHSWYQGAGAQLWMPFVKKRFDMFEGDTNNISLDVKSVCWIKASLTITALPKIYPWVALGNVILPSFTHGLLEGKTVMCCAYCVLTKHLSGSNYLPSKLSLVICDCSVLSRPQECGVLLDLNFIFSPGRGMLTVFVLRLI